MKYVGTQEQLDIIFSNLKAKFVPQTIFMTDKLGLGMRRASKKPPKNSVVIGVFTYRSTKISAVIAVNKLASEGLITFEKD